MLSFHACRSDCLRENLLIYCTGNLSEDRWKSGRRQETLQICILVRPRQGASGSSHVSCTPLGITSKRLMSFISKPPYMSKIILESTCLIILMQKRSLTAWCSTGVGRDLLCRVRHLQPSNMLLMGFWLSFVSSVTQVKSSCHKY